VLSALPGGLLGRRHGLPPATVVALHGWRRTSKDFDAVLAGLDAAAPDLPGFGATAPPVAVWGAADYAAAVLPVCAEGPPVVVLGHSFGGRVAVMLAAAHPDRVCALVLTGVPLGPSPGARQRRASRSFRVARRLNQLRLLSDDRMEARRHQSGSDDYRAARGVMRDVLVRAVAETTEGAYRLPLGAIRCPVELVWGEHDTTAPPAVAEEAAALLSDPRLTILRGVGHLTPTDAPSALRAALDRLV
jgi:pimeloyl-ACP methyl ester carboxylesterase